MKKLYKLHLGLILIAGVVFSSCSKDNTSTPEMSRSTILGTWLENDSGKKITYEVTFVSDSSSTNGIWIYNFGGCGQKVKAIAYLSGTSLALNGNELLSNGWILNGTGSVTNANLINWPYSLHDGADLYNIQATFTRK